MAESPPTVGNRRGPPPLKPPKPRWLKRGPQPLVTVALPDQPRDEHWLNLQQLKSYAFSITLHLILLTLLSLFVFRPGSGNFGLSLNSGFGKGNSETLEDNLLAGDPGETAPSTDFLKLGAGLEMVNTFREFSTADALIGGTGGLGGDGDGDDEGGGDGGLTGLPTLNVPSYAVTKGSFTTWADPKDPLPRQDYFVVVQVKLTAELADKIKKYPVSRDLYVRVRGTDRYRREETFRGVGPLTIKDGLVEVRVKIPGGDQLVRDEVYVKSKILKEDQTFTIEF